MAGSLFPVITGVVSLNAGVAVLQPIPIGLLTATTISWLLVFRPKALDTSGLHQVDLEAPVEAATPVRQQLP